MESIFLQQAELGGEQSVSRARAAPRVARFRATLCFLGTKFAHGQQPRPNEREVVFNRRLRAGESPREEAFEALAVHDQLAAIADN